MKQYDKEDAALDPMTELFYDESNSILQEMRRGMVERKGIPFYNQDMIQSVFRSVHTLKASSTMMLFENLAEVSKNLEEMLYCFRGKNKEITDTGRFDDILVSYLDFFERETDKLSMGVQPEERADDLEKKIKAYIVELTDQMASEEMEAYHQEISKPKRQIFYIASATETERGENGSWQDSQQSEAVGQRGAEEEISWKTDNLVDTQSLDSMGKKEGDNAGKPVKKKYVLSEKKREMIFRGTRNLQRVINSLEYSMDKSGTGTVTTEQLQRLKEIEKDFLQIKKYLTKTDFVPVAKKMEVVVDEMSMKLGKRVRLLVKGEHTPVDFEVREKISNALIHVIRNAVDHGIEDMEERERLGKAPVGLVKLRFTMKDGSLKVTVKDDGRGIDTEGILRKAEEQGFLQKSLTDYSREEVFALMLESGLTTTENPNEYSGRGVGMDVIAHTVEELGGKLKIFSKPDEGTTVTMRF